MIEGWQTETLAEVCEFSNGLWKGDKPPFVRIGVIRNTNFTKEGTLNDSDIAYLDVEVKKLEKRRLKFGDVILEKSGGGPKQPVGRVALFVKSDGDFSFSNFTAALRVRDSQKLDFRFLHKSLHWTYVSGVTEGMQSHSTGIRNLDGDAYKAIKISFPSIAEQKRIVAILDEAFEGIDTAIANAKKNLANARELFDSYLSSIFLQKGEEWVEKKLGDPALKAAGWGVVEASRVRREVITLGRLQGAGVRAAQDIADYVLTYRNHKLAVIEAKRRDLPDTEGVGQAKKHAAKLQTRFACSTNGVGIYQVDMTTGAEQYVAAYPTPDELWHRVFAEENAWRDRFAVVPFEDKGGQWQARYYQDIAIRRVLEAIAAGQDRILLTLATGTGKTFIAFQLAWKLFQARWNLADWKSGGEPTRRPRILFLADRNILADQAYNSFSAFQDDALVRIDPEIIRKKGRVPKNGNVFFTIFQTFMTGRDAAGQPAPSFGDYPPDFFDIIIIDECHRGGANDEGNWRAILNYFAPAVQLGLTATPKRKANVDTYAYFGEPVYTYSLRDGINDGFLTPFKVKQIATTLDEYVYTSDDELIEAEVEEGRRYTESDFNRVIEITARERYRVKLFMDAIDQSQKTIVFCATQDHALAVRDLVNQMKTSQDPNYCVRVTARDGPLGDQFLRTFQDNDKTIPTILTTSQKLSTGVDARNVRNIVLMRPVNSMIEFKQIIGRGTRLFDGKDYFTIYDFVKAYEHFSDPEWDGEPADPVLPAPPRGGGEPKPAGGGDGEPGGEDDPPPPQKLKIRLADGKERSIQHMTATTFWSVDGRPMSAAEFVTRLFGELPALFKDEDELRALWSQPDTRKALLDGLAEKGYGREQLREIERMIDAEKSDLYDVLAYIAFALSPISRQQRVDARRAAIFSHYDAKLQTFLDFVLSQYIKEGVGELDQAKLPHLLELQYRAVSDAAAQLGGVATIRDAFIGFQQHLYR